MHVIQQLHFLWERNIVELLFAPVLALSPDAGGEQKSECTLVYVFSFSLSLSNCVCVCICECRMCTCIKTWQM